MEFWPVNEMTELVSGMPAPQFGAESSWVRGSELVQGSSGSCVSFSLMWDVFVYPQGYAYHRLIPTALTYSESSIIRINLGGGVRVNEANYCLKNLRKQINGKCNNIHSSGENKTYLCSNFFLCQKLISSVSFVQLRPMLDIFLRGFDPSSWPRHSLKVHFKHVLNFEQNFSFLIFLSGLSDIRINWISLEYSICNCLVLIFVVCISSFSVFLY
jgi:hypothetical protein